MSRLPPTLRPRQQLRCQLLQVFGWTRFGEPQPEFGGVDRQPRADVVWIGAVSLDQRAERPRILPPGCPRVPGQLSDRVAYVRRLPIDDRGDVPTDGKQIAISPITVTERRRTGFYWRPSAFRSSCTTTALHRRGGCLDDPGTGLDRPRRLVRRARTAESLTLASRANREPSEIPRDGARDPDLHPGQLSGGAKDRPTPGSKRTFEPVDQCAMGVDVGRRLSLQGATATVNAPTGDLSIVSVHLRSQAEPDWVA